MTALYWGCVAACVAAAVLLIGARRQLSRQSAATPPTEPTTPKEKAPAAEKAPAEEPAAVPAAPTPAEDLPDPEVEDVEVTDLLLVVDLKDEVLVVDEHPRYHVAGCRWLKGRAT